jgi:hypothetical protein
MVLIHFTDAQGTEWEVWEVGARAAPADVLSPVVPRQERTPERWLCFASATERRRLVLYPERWHAMSPAELDALCRLATPARPAPPFLPPSAPGPGPRDVPRPET